MNYDILTTSISLFASKSAFSLSKQILDEKHLSMSHENLDMAVCLEDWYDAKDRQQNNLREDGLSFGEGSGN